MVSQRLYGCWRANRTHDARAKQETAWTAAYDLAHRKIASQEDLQYAICLLHDMTDPEREPADDIAAQLVARLRCWVEENLGKIAS